MRFTPRMPTNQERAVHAATAKAKAAIVADLQQALADSGMKRAGTADVAVGTTWAHALPQPRSP